MKTLTLSQFEMLTAAAHTLCADERGPKVLQTPGGRIIKLFRRKRLLSSAMFVPYAVRFAHISRELARRGVPAICVEQVAHVPHLHRDMVVYGRLEGSTLRETIDCAPALLRNQLIELLARQLAMMHARGVYFRAAHFGNFVVRVDEAGFPSLALIDLLETRFRRRPLSLALRVRNFQPLTRYSDDFDAIRGFGLERFLEAYGDAAALTPRDVHRFRKALRRRIQSWHSPGERADIRSQNGEPKICTPRFSDGFAISFASRMPPPSQKPAARSSPAPQKPSAC